LNEKIYLITFDSTHHAIRGEKFLKEKNLDVRTIPTPREITASCGLSIKFNIDNLENVKEIIKINDLVIKGIYELNKKDKNVKLICN